MSETRLLIFLLVIISFFYACKDAGSDSHASNQATHETTVTDDYRVIRVTNLNEGGEGSLRDALTSSGQRVVVFEVGGIIDLNKNTIIISEPFLYVAGQTAPSPGVTVIRGSIYIGTHDVTIKHIRVRPGDAGEPKLSGWEPDGISTFGGNAYNVVIDHCSLTWAVDENLSASGPRTEGKEKTSHNITFSNCIIAECLDNASHRKGQHSKGMLIHDFCQSIYVIGNFFAHNAERNPYFKAHTTGVIANNLIYNPESAAIQLDYVEDEWTQSEFKPENCKVSIVGNVLIYGQNTDEGLALVSRRGDAFMEDNIAMQQDSQPAPLFSGEVIELKQKPVWPAGFTAIPASEVADYVITNAGARPNDRDEIDKRIIREFVNRKGRIIDSQNDVGGYPHMQTTRHDLEVPNANLGAWLNELASKVE